MTRIAMIGGGPKSLYALLALHDALEGQKVGPLQVDVYDPYPPGAGRVWNVRQPQELRLNVNARIIDASSSLSSWTFDQWRRASAQQLPEDPYPPRALVGQYLTEQFERLAKLGNMRITHRPLAVHQLVRSGRNWEVHTAQGCELYTEVVLATGHGLPGYRAANCAPEALLAAELTVESYAADSVPGAPQSEVVIRGAALTAYDVVLRLTERRGGSFATDTVDGLECLRFLPGGAEPQSITMTSRSNILMIPKPQEVPATLQLVLANYREHIREWGQNLTETGGGLDTLWQVLLSCAKDCAELSGLPASKDSLWETLKSGSSEHMQTLGGPAEQLRWSLRANHGLETPTHEWVWAIVWSGVYPQLVSSLSRIQWQVSEREKFRKLAGNLERMAFGPPEPTALKLLALFEAGILKQQPVSSPTNPQAVVIDAVTAPAGVISQPADQRIPATDLFAGLLSQGEIQIRQGERGLLTDTDGTCRNARGERNETLAALGRPTEDPTLGHDTLNRTLHPEYQLWAQRIARKVSAPSQKVAS